jgi:hypothetical protein
MKCTLGFFLVALLALPLFAQQTHVNRYDAFTGFSYMVSPSRNLNERGFNGEFGVNATRWLSLGGDFSVLTGSGDISVQHTVFAPLVAGVPPNQLVGIPFDSTTYTFAAGPQFSLRKWKKVTFFARPGLGGIHEVADLDVTVLAPLRDLGITLPAVNTHQTDTAVFFGAGGGVDLNVSRPIGIRFTVDWVNTHLFSDLLTNRQNYVRFSVGPTFRWGALQ